MTPRKSIALIVMLAMFALSGCGGGGGGDNGGGPSPTQPVRAVVFIAFDQPVTNLAGLDLTLNNTPGATFDNNAQQVAAINNAAAAALSLAVGNFDPATNTNKIVFINSSPSGFNTGTTPILRVTYDIAAGSGSPTFSIVSQATFSAIAPDNGPTSPPVSAANVVVTVTYE